MPIILFSMQQALILSIHKDKKIIEMTIAILLGQ